MDLIDEKEDKNLYLPPIKKVIDKLKESNRQRIFLLGPEGSGKTTVLDYFHNTQSDIKNPIFNHSDLAYYGILTNDTFIFELYNTCCILQKLIKRIAIYDNSLFCTNFFTLFGIVNNILNKIRLIYSIGEIDDISILDLKEYDSAELINEFWQIAKKAFESITLIFDNFDVQDINGKFWQKYINNFLSKYFHIIATISDINVLNNADKIESLNQDSDVIFMDYSFDREVIKEILDLYIFNLYKNDINVFTKRVRFVLSDELIDLMIEKTNGNIFIILVTVQVFYKALDIIPPNDYQNFILSFIDLNFNNEFKNGKSQTLRKLYI